MQMKTATAGLNLLKEFEQCRLKAYKDSGGVWTIGWGHTGKDVHEGLYWTLAQCDAALVVDVEDAENAVNKHVTAMLTQNEFDALVCLVYNIGEDQFAKSTLLKLLNAADYDGAAEQFKRWDWDNGHRMPGLTRRRAAEYALFERTT